ncbi:MAG TPA: DUF3015 domain-containing protein [Leucothrix mucor]|uniref:DUF3015 domain-containing protein n=1 Tax=Leucothrix mucor TaxID=45248 RepID=A0A7V2WU40_LEUMU|nr:DUF3015 domain-containing protein [Leucothrix mucor]
MKHKYRTRVAVIASLLFISACNMGPGHVPRGMEVLAPVVAVSNTISKATYKRTINKIERYLSNNYDVLKNETYQGEGAHLEQLILLVERDGNKTSLFKNKLQQEYSSLFNNSRHISMRISSISAQLLPKNQRPYIPPYQVRMNLLSDIDANYDAFRIAIKNRDIRRLSRTADILSVSLTNREQFYNQLSSQYDSVFLKPVAVRIYQILKTKS